MAGKEIDKRANNAAMPLADVSNTEWRVNDPDKLKAYHECHLLMLVTPNGGPLNYPQVASTPGMPLADVSNTEWRISCTKVFELHVSDATC